MATDTPQKGDKVTTIHGEELEVLDVRMIQTKKRKAFTSDVEEKIKQYRQKIGDINKELKDKQAPIEKELNDFLNSLSPEERYQKHTPELRAKIKPFNDRLLEVKEKWKSKYLQLKGEHSEYLRLQANNRESIAVQMFLAKSGGNRGNLCWFPITMIKNEKKEE